MSNSEENTVNWRPDARTVMEKIRPVIEKVERVRVMAIAKKAKAQKRTLLVVGVGIAVALVALAGGERIGVSILVIAGLTGIAGVLVYMVSHGGATAAYRDIFKREIFANAVREAVPGMTYSPTSMIPMESFKQGGLFKSRIDRYSGEDCFSGKVGATELIFSELHVQRKDTSRDSKGNTTTTWVTLFKGIYLIADFHKHFAGRVVIEQDVAEAHFGWVGRKMQGVSGNLVRLESPEFEKAFKVTADDALAARYLLTPDMQERFLALREGWSSGVSAVLMDSHLHLALPMTEDWFEPNISVPAGDVPVLHGFLLRLMIVVRITETLDLNTRLWTKE